MHVETTGSFMLIDLPGRQEIPAEGVVEVAQTPFIEWALDAKMLREVGGKVEEPVADLSAPTSGRAAASKGK